jgi:hypothetical protein
MPTTSSLFFTTTDAGSVPLAQTTAFQSKKDVKMAAGTMASSSLHHKGLEFCETTIAKLEIKRKITGLSSREANRMGINTSCALQIEMKDKSNKAQTCVLLFRTMVPKLAGANGLKEGDVYVTLMTYFHRNCKSKKEMATYLPLTLKTHGDARLEALGRGEHVHVDFIETLVEEIQLTMQDYTAPVRPPRANAKGSVKSSAVINRKQSSTKHAKRQVVVHDGGEVAGALTRNALKNEATRFAKMAAVRADIKKKVFQLEKTKIANNIAVLDFAEQRGVRFTLQVGVNCAVCVFFAFASVQYS